jgi:hypothetical protein
MFGTVSQAQPSSSDFDDSPTTSYVWLANCYFACLARTKMPSGANAFEISDIQEEETEV